MISFAAQYVRRGRNRTKIEIVIGCIIRLITLGCAATQTCRRNEKEPMWQSCCRLEIFPSVSAETQKRSVYNPCQRNVCPCNPPVSVITRLWNGYCAFLLLWMSKTWAAAAEYNSEIGPWWMCLFRGARSWERWAVWCHCLKHTSLNMGPQSREESTDGRPLLRSPDSSDLIMQLYKWRHRADGNDVCVGHRVGQERCPHPGGLFHRQNINVSYYILVLPFIIMDFIQ